MEWPSHPTRYERGERLRLEATGICPAQPVVAEVTIEKFVGGGYAGQVYRTRLDALDGDLSGLQIGQICKIKIIKPASGLALRFRNALYWLGFQGAFSAQVNPAAIRAGALWQALIQRGAKVRFGRGDAVCAVHATFWDPRLRSHGEISEWVEGRQWRFELDDRCLDRGKTEHSDTGEPLVVGAPEYMAKRRFMADFVQLLHDMGASELARQYEWWTMKSQPNALKRNGVGPDPGDGLSAIDFRSGLALLPCLPMSPADVALIFRGLRRGSWVQFDRGDLDRLDEFVRAHEAEFEDLQGVLAELREVEPLYRRSLPDVTHHGLRLLTDRGLRQDVVKGTADAWVALGQADAGHGEKLQRGGLRFLAFWCLGIVPLLGKLCRRLWGHAQFRRHVARCLTEFRYLLKAMDAARASALIEWHRSDRVSDTRALALAKRPVLFWLNRVFFGLLPARWHRFLTDGSYAWSVLHMAVTHPLRLLFNEAYREKWLTDQVQEGLSDGMLADHEAQAIIEHIREPFIQRYLKACAVHVCTLPVTQVVSVIVAVWAAWRYGKTWEEAWAYGVGVLIAFQVIPISPGSLVRGLYAVYVMARDRDVKRYRIAVFISFWKYIGYLAFPIQMVAEYPVLAQFMAGRWATHAVRVVPVFGEHGALLEHAAFDLFFNVPLTLRHSWHRRREAKQRAKAEAATAGAEGGDSPDAP